MAGGLQILHGFDRATHAVRAGDARPPLIVLLGALVLCTVLFVAKLAIGVHDHLSTDPDSLTDARAATVTVGPFSLTLPRNMIRSHSLPRGSVSSLDLHLHWPTLHGLTEETAAAFDDTAATSPVIYATLRRAQGPMSPWQRFRQIHSRLVEDTVIAGRDGLDAQRFIAGNGYDGETLYVSSDPAMPFVARCTAATAAVPSVCSSAFRSAGMDVDYRFRKPLLEDWRSLDRQMRLTIAGFRSGR